MREIASSEDIRTAPTRPSTSKWVEKKKTNNYVHRDHRKLGDPDAFLRKKKGGKGEGIAQGERVSQTRPGDTCITRESWRWTKGGQEGKAQTTGGQGDTHSETSVVCAGAILPCETVRKRKHKGLDCGREALTQGMGGGMLSGSPGEAGGKNKV